MVQRDTRVESRVLLTKQLEGLSFYSTYDAFAEDKKFKEEGRKYEKVKQVLEEKVW